MPEIPLGALYSSISKGLPSSVAFGAMATFALMIGMALFFGYYRRKLRHPDSAHDRSPREASDLFLKVDYRLDGHPEPVRRGYLRSLTLNRASIVANDRSLEKGTGLDLVLKTEAPAGKRGSVHGRVTGKKSLGGNPESWQFDIRFARRNEPEKTLLRDYLQKALNRDL